MDSDRDFMNIDEEYKPEVNGATADVAQKKRLYPLPKNMKASSRTRPMNQNKMRERVAQMQGPIASSSGSRQSDVGFVPKMTVQSFKGQCAPYNDHANWVQDPFNSKVYMIGGIRPSDDEDWEPTSDLFCYDTRTMEWEDLTDALAYREPYDPYSTAEFRRPKKRLPARSQPGCTLWRLEDISFIFMFGGCDLATGSPTSEVVIINLQAREWWNERINQNSPTPRIAPAIVAVQNRVYIFGGYRSYDEDPLACYSFSVAEWNPAAPAAGGGSRWTWIHSDSPYTEPMPPTACIGEAISVYEGKLIFLAPGRTNGLDSRVLDFTVSHICYFRTGNCTFKEVALSGDPPRDIQWYSIFDLQTTFNHHPNSPPFLSSSTSSPSGVVRKRGRPRKHPLPVPLPVRVQAPVSGIPPTRSLPQPTTPIPPSIVICAWLNQPSNSRQEGAGEEYNFPDIYRFLFHPDDTCISLNVKARIAALNRDFQGCSYTHRGHLCLLGNYQAEETDSEQEVEKTWNIYLNVPLEDPASDG